MTFEVLATMRTSPAGDTIPVSLCLSAPSSDEWAECDQRKTRAVCYWRSKKPLNTDEHLVMDTLKTKQMPPGM